MTRSKASTSAWGRLAVLSGPKDLRREAGTLGSAEVGAAQCSHRRHRGRATARGAIITGTFCPCYNHAKERAHPTASERAGCSKSRTFCGSL